MLSLLLGDGMRLTPALSPDAELTFKGARPLDGGSVEISYAPTGNPGKAEMTTRDEREIHVERVFAAFTDPELIPRWWGPHGTTTRVEELEARPGGHWRFAIVDPDGAEQRFRGVFREVSPPDRLVWTFEWEGLPGRVSVETARFEDLGERTRIVNDTIFHTREERDGMLKSGIEKGMNETCARLDALLAGSDA